MRFITQNFGWKLLSLALAIGVWMTVASEPELATIVSVPVEYNRIPNDLEISSAITDSIDLEARGPSGEIRSLRDSHLAAIVDFGSVTAPGERTFTLTSSEIKLPRGVTLIRTIPAQLRFRFEHRLTREIPVDVIFSGKLAPGLTVTGIETSPSQLQIVGPESHVIESKKLVTDSFDLTAVAGDTEQTLAVYAAEPEVRIVASPRVTVKIHVQPKR